MIGLGSIINALMIAVGGILGCFIKDIIPQKVKDGIMQAFGLVMLVVGISGTLGKVFYVSKYGALDSRYIMITLISLILGTLIGTLLNVEQRFYRLGEVFQKKMKQGSSFAEGLINTSIMYCVGGMAIVGAMQEGLEGRIDILFVKGVLDGVSALVYSTTMGLGVVFSSFSVLIYQWSITFLSLIIKTALTNQIIDQIALVGNVLVIALGMNLLKIMRINIANMLPAIFVPLIWYFIVALTGAI